MLAVRRAEDRGLADLGWLLSRHTFSFSEYHDPEHMGFRGLRVINEDRVEPGRGFGTHGHRDMEIVSYVLEGALRHKDSMGTGSVIVPGDVQRMSAGTGVMHSEFNASETEAVHFLQIWLLPSKRGIAPGYEQKSFDAEGRRGRLRLVASPDGSDASVTVHADVRLYASLLDRGQSVEHVVNPGRYAWIQVARGKVNVAGAELGPGDGGSTGGPAALRIEGVEAAELLLFDLS